MSDELPTARRVPGTSASARMRKRSERKLLNVSDLFPPSARRPERAGSSFATEGSTSASAAGETCARKSGISTEARNPPVSDLYLQVAEKSMSNSGLRHHAGRCCGNWRCSGRICCRIPAEAANLLEFAALS
jgi:hypothetical protein